MKKAFILISLLFFSILLFSQNHDSLTYRKGEIYFLDGRKSLPTNILEGWENQDSITIRYSEYWPIREIPKSEVHYIYYNGEYHLINEITYFQDMERVRRNLALYRKQANLGWISLGVGTGALLSSFTIIDVQAKKFEDGKITLDEYDKNKEVAKVLTYAGYGLMILGVGIHIDAGKYLKRGNIDITPVGIRYNF